MEPLTRIHPSAAAVRAAFHAGNLFVKKARNLLTEQGIAFTYLEYGSYVSQWKQRLAVKMWSGWPTFPQVFIGGALVGGFNDLKALHESGELAQLVAAAKAN